jgi:hypothetical protein
LASVKDAVTVSASVAKAQADTASSQLDALNNTVAGLGVLNKSVLSVADAINN